MLVVAYVLRYHGEKLDGEIVRSRPVQGWLYLGPDMRKQYPADCARLFPSDGVESDLIEPMVHPSVRTKRGGLLVRGLEEVRSSVTRRQAWFCVPGLLDDVTAGITMPGPYDTKA